MLFGAPGEPKREPAANNAPLFRDLQAEQLFFARHASERRSFGTSHKIGIYKRRNYRATTLEQRSGRRRLYDHNIFLRGAFTGKVLLREGYSLGVLLDRGLFLDIGSAILYGEGAPTVRDVHEDETIAGRFFRIVATDVNDESSARTRYIEIYRRQKTKLPFPVEQIGARLIEKEQFTALIDRHSYSKTSAVVLRSANSGPDLYYSQSEVQAHLAAIRAACHERTVLYFFGSHVLFKNAYEHMFDLIGTVDERVGSDHLTEAWTRIDWKTRTLADAFRPLNGTVTIR